MDQEDFHHYMGLALEAAQKAAEDDEVPVGAVLVLPDRGLVLAERNRVIGAKDPTAHAEILAMRRGAEAAGNYRLVGGALFCSVEPCPMCMGAAIHARLSLIVYGAADPKWGAAGSLYRMHEDERLNHRIEVVAGVRAEESAEMLKSFFAAKRNQKKASGKGA